MGTIKKSILSSLVKKFVMAITGFVLASFLLVHMLGNLQTLEGGPHAINAYANFLQTLPWEFLWGFRCALAACFVLHFLMAYLLVVENNKARPQTYAVKKNLASTFASRTMIYTGTIVIAFGIIHILHYTMLKLNPEFKVLDWVATSGMYEGKTLHDVYAMMILGFSNTWVSLAYIFNGSYRIPPFPRSFEYVPERWLRDENEIPLKRDCRGILRCNCGRLLDNPAVLISKYTPSKLCLLTKWFRRLKNKSRRQISDFRQLRLSKIGLHRSKNNF
ncbi:MAG: hypothetical protein ACLUKN_16540 [Bacilli bacterium]